MILEIDCGNSRIKWRLREDSGKVNRGSQAAHQSENELFAAVALAAASIGLQSIEQVWVVSVLGEQWDEQFRLHCKSSLGVEPKFAVSQARRAGVTNGYVQPTRLGNDRWLAILAAYREVQQACVIADLGSALTVDMVNDNGEHLGGYIAPGLRLMRRALCTDTKKIIIAEVPGSWNASAGRDTESAVTAAQSAMVNGLITQALAELSHADKPTKPILFITGGDGEWLLPRFPEALFRPDLVLDGLAPALA